VGAIEIWDHSDHPLMDGDLLLLTGERLLAAIHRHASCAARNRQFGCRQDVSFTRLQSDLRGAECSHSGRGDVDGVYTGCKPAEHELAVAPGLHDSSRR